jgi:hypothetical protein
MSDIQPELPQNDFSTPEPIDEQGRLSILVEMDGAPGASPASAMGEARAMAEGGAMVIDEEFEAVSLRPTSEAATASETYVVRATVEADADLEALEAQPGVRKIWRDTPIAPFTLHADLDVDTAGGPGLLPDELADPHPVGDEGEAAAPSDCPIPPCDCTRGTANGTIAQVATTLGIDDIWSLGHRGQGMVVGVVDGGITAQGRPVGSGETSRRIPRVTGGWPVADWGTKAAAWGEHGNMCATDVLGMAPEANIYDLRISGSGGSPATISRALQAFQWAINRFRTDGTPHILTNSWGIFQETWDASYARNPNHPFTRKVVEAMDEGILVLFAAGNCGETCPDGRCGPDTGPGRSIWGANSHPRVMTVGAVNIDDDFVGYSSQGPGALDPDKPDFCSITHFRGYYSTRDGGTSAATPILAGGVALIKQANPSATQDQIKTELQATAKDIGPTGFDRHSGAGIVQVREAYRALNPGTAVRSRLVSGSTPSGSTDWRQYGSAGLYVDVDTSSGGFTDTPVYVTNLTGTSNHWTTTGGSAVYLATPTGFRVYVRAANNVTPAVANQRRWAVSWLAFG